MAVGFVTDIVGATRVRAMRGAPSPPGGGNGTGRVSEIKFWAADAVESERETSVQGSVGRDNAKTSASVGHHTSSNALAPTFATTTRGGRPIAVAVSETVTEDSIPGRDVHVVRRQRLEEGQRRAPPTGPTTVKAADMRKADDVALAAPSRTQEALAKDDVVSRTTATDQEGSDVRPNGDDPTAHEKAYVEDGMPGDERGG